MLDFIIDRERILQESFNEELVQNLSKKLCPSNNANIAYIQDCIMSLQLRDDIDKNLKNIERVLNREYKNMECESVYISNNTGEFFGMRVYLTDNYVSNLADALISKNIHAIDEYVSDTHKIIYTIEIDSQILFNKTVSFNSSEIMAILLHEIGHIQFDSNRFTNMKLALMRALKDNNMTIDDLSSIVDYDKFIVQIYVIECFEKDRLYNLENKSISVELEADSFVVSNKYSEDLMSALDKFKKYNSVRVDFKKPYQEEAKLAVGMRQNFNTRNNYIMSALKMEKKKNTNRTLNKLLDRILDSKSKIFNNWNSRVNTKARNSGTLGLLREETRIRENERMKLLNEEGFIDKFLSNPIKITKSDIDELRIETEMIQSYNDKLVVSMKVHKRLDQLNISEQKCKSKSNSKELLNIVDIYRKDLEYILKTTMDKKIQDKKYGVFVKYPDDYEG